MIVTFRLSTCNPTTFDQHSAATSLASIHQPNFISTFLTFQSPNNNFRFLNGPNRLTRNLTGTTRPRATAHAPIPDPREHPDHAQPSQPASFPSRLIGGACNRGWGPVERRGRSLCQQLSTSQSATGTRHPPTKRCSRSHCTLDRQPHDPLCCHPSRRSHPKSLQR